MTDLSTALRAAYFRRANPDQIITAVQLGAALWVDHRDGPSLIHINEDGCAYEVHGGAARIASLAIPFAECADPRGSLFAYPPADLAAYRELHQRHGV